MSIKTFLVSLVIGIILVGILVLVLNRPKSPLPNPLSTSSTTKQIQPSETFIEYLDPSGFSFSYPDNLSISKNEVDPDLIGVDETTYADIQLFSKDVSGSLSLKVADSKFKTIEDWVNLNKGESKEVKLGTLKALEIKTKDRLLLGALDQGVLFTIEMPLLEENFWMEVYNKLLADFSFVVPEENDTVSESDVIFEGEEVIE